MAGDDLEGESCLCNDHTAAIECGTALGAGLREKLGFERELDDIGHPVMRLAAMPMGVALTMPSTASVAKSLGARAVTWAAP